MKGQLTILYLSEKTFKLITNCSVEHERYPLRVGYKFDRCININGGQVQLPIYQKTSCQPCTSYLFSIVATEQASLFAKIQRNEVVRSPFEEP